MYTGDFTFNNLRIIRFTVCSGIALIEKLIGSVSRATIHNAGSGHVRAGNQLLELHFRI